MSENKLPGAVCSTTHSLFTEADSLYQEIDRENSGKITPGILLYAMEELGIDVNAHFANSFLRLDLDGNDVITVDEWRHGYQVNDQHFFCFSTHCTRQPDHAHVQRFVKNAWLRFRKAKEKASEIENEPSPPTSPRQAC